MKIQDVKSWTYGFMKRNESQCVEYIVSLRDDALYAVGDGDFQKASRLYRDIAYGMEKLSEIDKDTYEPPFYAAAFCVAKVEAFGLQNREEAVKQLKLALEIAKKCAEYDRTNPSLAERDLEVISQFLSKMETDAQFLKLLNEFSEDEWNLANEAAFVSFRTENTVSGLGCLALIAMIIIFFVLYSIVMEQLPTPVSL